MSRLSSSRPPIFPMTFVFVALVGCKPNKPTNITEEQQQREKQEQQEQAQTERKQVSTVKMVPDVSQRLAQFAPTDVDFDEKLVSAEDRKVLVKLVQAAQLLDEIYLDQVSPNNRELRQHLVQEKVPQAVLDYFDIMYGPWDRLKNDEPFVGDVPKPVGAGFYPPDLTKADLEAWIKKASPQEAAALKGYFTVVRRDGDKLKAVPYPQAYGDRLKQASALLKEAAALTKHAALKKYLALRGDALMSNDYFASDMAWMDLGDSPLEVVLGPYEVYEDKLMGYKAAMEAFITLRDPDYSARLQKLAAHNQEVEKNLPLEVKYHTRRGTSSPISVVIELFTAGDTRAGVQTAAFNLPNDERVRTKKGSKKVMLKNVTEAKFKKVLIPIATEVVDSALLPLLDFDTYFTDILLHEMAHGMGPGEITVDGRKTSVNSELKQLYPAIEECKADIVGLVNGAYLITKGALPKEMERRLPATYLAGVFRAVRFGTEEAHGKAVLLAFNYLFQGGAFTYDKAKARFGVNYDVFDKRVRELAGELLLLQARGSYDHARKLLERNGTMSPEMRQALTRLKHVPVDIKPNYTIVQKMQSW